MKNILTTFLLLSVLICKSQSLTLIGNRSCIWSDINSNTKRINKEIVITYSQKSSLIYIEGQGSIFFMNDEYEQKLYNGYIHEFIISQETSTTPRGYYSIMIDKKNKNNTFQLIISNRGTYFVDNVKIYSENGLVKGNIYVKNWKELEEKTKESEKILKENKEKEKEKIILQRKMDSMDIVNRERNKMVKIDNDYLKGENINKSDLKDIISLIQNKIKTLPNEYFYSDMTLEIDENGNLISVYKSNNSGNVIEKYVPKIFELLKSEKFIPFVGSNGKKYKSKCTFYLTLIRSK